MGAAQAPRNGGDDARREPTPIERSAPVISRRALLRGFGTGAIALSVFAACDRDPSDRATPSGSPTPAATPDAETPAVDWDAWWREQEITGTLDFANWPYYIDRRRDGSHPSIDRFTQTNEIAVNYYRPIRENARFLDRIRPALQAGEPIGYDLIVISNGPELSELIGSGWVVPLDHSRLPNFERFAGPLVRGPIWDPENRFSIAWQSGLTGIAYAPEAAELLGHEPRSVEDLWNPALRGKVGMLSDLVELGSVGLLAAGIDPSVSTPDNWRTAAGILEAQKEAVDPRYYDQGYVEAISRRDTLITLAYSGDIFQLNNLGDPDLRFVVPAEGAMLWTDNLLIPTNAAHPLDALTYMNFVYRPTIAATIADWVWYICTVPAAQRIVAQDLGNPAVARSPLVFPGAELIGDLVDSSGAGTELLGSRVHDYYVYADAEEYEEWTSVFEPIVYV